MYVNYFYPQDVVQAGDDTENGFLLILPVILPVFARCMHGSLFTYGDSVKNDIYKDDQSAEDILRCDCQIRRVDYQRQIPGDKIAAI